MKYSLACCYLTHNHPDVMKEILDKCLSDYANHGIDICIYDDSDNDDTKKLIENYVSEGASNLYYVDAHMAINADHKLLLIFQGVGLPKDYDYVWPTKDRVCFSSSYLDKLCECIDEGYDFVIGMNDSQRWDVGVKVSQDVYTNPVEFYRRYCMYTTNWESSVRKRETMLKPVDWEAYRRDYNVSENNNFNQTVSLFVRMSEMESVSIKKCIYNYDERYISPNSTSGWGNILFELWIDRWVTANYSLPSIYDNAKAEAIKTETNLSELFGSVERMIEFHSAGMYTPEIFEKYRTIWPFVTEIPVNVLEMIANDNYEGAFRSVIIDFEHSVSTHSFGRAWWLLASNLWLDKYYDEKTYGVLVMCFNQYRRDMMNMGASAVFDGCNSVGEIMQKYLYLTER